MTIIVASGALAYIESSVLLVLLSEEGTQKAHKARWLVRGNLAKHSQYTNLD
jgi:hypothetical protein